MAGMRQASIRAFSSLARINHCHSQPWSSSAVVALMPGATRIPPLSMVLGYGPMAVFPVLALIGWLAPAPWPAIALAVGSTRAPTNTPAGVECSVSTRVRTTASRRTATF